MLKTTWKTEYKGHVIELENRPGLERLIVDGKEIAREPGATWEPRSFQATIPDGSRSMKLDANTRFSKSPRGPTGTALPKPGVSVANADAQYP